MNSGGKNMRVLENVQRFTLHIFYNKYIKTY